MVHLSVNVFGEPIVGSPDNAVRCFMDTELDVLVAGDCDLPEEQQDPALQQSHETAFESD
jgi:carbamoyltransferase